MSEPCVLDHEECSSRHPRCPRISINFSCCALLLFLFLFGAERFGVGPAGDRFGAIQPFIARLAKVGCPPSGQFFGRAVERADMGMRFGRQA